MRANLPITAGTDILTDCQQADALRRRLEPILTGDDVRVVLDFSGINGVSVEFLDALLGPLHERFGPQLAERLHLDGCSAALLNDLRSAAEQGRSADITTADANRRRSAAA